MTPGVDRPFDSGLQVERTLLAWMRTCLALALGNAIAIRFLIEVLGPVAAVIGAVGIALSALAGLLATARYRRAHHGLTREGRLRPDGKLPLLVTCAVGAGCVAGLLIVIGARAP